jgi:hypothetical protein
MVQILCVRQPVSTITAAQARRSKSILVEDDCGGGAGSGPRVAGEECLTQVGREAERRVISFGRLGTWER